MDWRAKVELYEQIRREYEFGAGSIIGVARKLGVHRRTVRDAVRSSLPARRKKTERPHLNIAPVAAFIDAVLEADRNAPRKQRHTAKRIWERIRSEVPGCTAAERTVRHYVELRKQELGLGLRETFVPQSYEWGVEAQVDWYKAYADLDGERVKLQVFSMRSMASGAADVDNGLTTETASSGSATMTYDGNHNLTYDGYNTLSYDVENRMVQAENAGWGANTYLYDPLGQRKQKVVGVNTAMPVATDFVLAGGAEIADYYETSATWRLTVRGADGLPLAAVVPAAGGGGEEIVYVHHDVKGSTVALTVAGGSGVGDSYTYSDYGASQSGSWLAYQYAGYRYDTETDLY